MSEDFVERRTHVRHRVLKAGRLAFQSGGSFECRVRNLSPAGARLDIAAPMALPEQFTLMIDADHFKQRCRPVWTRDNQIGVAFE